MWENGSLLYLFSARQYSHRMVIFRYFLREIFVSLIALTSIILLIFLSNQFVQYLSRAANGQLPGMVIFQLMLLEVPNLLALLLPLGFYVAILLAYGRLYADNEMTVLKASGFTTARLFRYTMSIGVMVALIVGLLMFWLSPHVYLGRAKLIRSQGFATLVKTIIPERFRAINGGRRVFYVKDLSLSHDVASGIFLAETSHKKQKDWRVVWAKEGHAEDNEKTGESFLVLNKGTMYVGTPGQADFKVYQFDKLKAKLPKSKLTYSDDVRTIDSTHLLPLNNPDLKKVAELNWRISVPVMAIVLAIIALPLSYVEPRQGKYAKLLPAIIIYVLYANMLFVGRGWLQSGFMPWWIGMWWLHAAMLALGLALLYWQRYKI